MRSRERARVVDRACEQEVRRAADDLEATTAATRVRLAAVTRAHVESTASRAHRTSAAMVRPRPRPH